MVAYGEIKLQFLFRVRHKTHQIENYFNVLLIASAIINVKHLDFAVW